MKAMVLRELGGPEKVQLEEVERPIPKKGEVLVKLKYAALNRRDYFITRGLYFGIKLPSILGADGAGVIAELGEGVDKFKVGDEIVIYPGLNWGDREECARPDFCTLGMPVDGTYAEYVTVPAENVYLKPKYLTWEEAAAFPLAAITAYRAVVTKGQVKKGDHVLIPGIGSGVALFALQIAAAIGANVYVTSSSDEKIERAKQLGAVGGINYRRDGWHKKLLEEVGQFQLVVDGVGGENLNHLISLTAPGGRIVSYGTTSGVVPEFNVARMFIKNVDLLGTALGSPREFARMLDLFEQHQIRPVIDRCFPLEATVEALKYMAKGGNFGKITVKISD